MTCQDCIHYNSIGTLCDKYIYPEERHNEPCNFFNTTCKNCIHFNKDIHPKPEWIGYNKCEKHTADGFQEYVGKDAEICEDYEDKDGLYSNGTWHCPRCGKAVSEWGLCNECECVGNALDALDSWESVSK